MASAPSRKSPTKLVAIVLGSIAFGVLMGLRPDFESAWARAIVAGLAFAVLAVCVALAAKRPAA